MILFLKDTVLELEKDQCLPVVRVGKVLNTMGPHIGVFSVMGFSVWYCIGKHMTMHLSKPIVL